MVFLLVGCALGLVLALGPLPFVQAPFDAVCDSLVRAVSQVLGSAFQVLPESWGLGDSSQAFAVALSAVSPGLAACLLVAAARAAQQVRQVVSTVVMLLGVASFFVLSPAQALSVLAVAAALAALLTFGTGALLTVPLTAVAVTLGVRVSRRVLADHGYLAGSVQRLTDLVGGDPGAWRLVLVVCVLAPLAWAAGNLLRGT
jgi:hypothetical protein